MGSLSDEVTSAVEDKGTVLEELETMLVKADVNRNTLIELLRD